MKVIGGCLLSEQSAFTFSKAGTVCTPTLSGSGILLHLLSKRPKSILIATDSLDTTVRAAFNHNRFYRHNGKKHEEEARMAPIRCTPSSRLHEEQRSDTNAQGRRAKTLETSEILLDVE